MLFMILTTSILTSANQCLQQKEAPLDKTMPLPELGYGENPDATLWYVDGTSGNDSNNGTISSPLKTIEAAQNKMSAGDTLVLRKGVYIVADNGSAEFDLKLNKSGAGPNQKTTYRAHYNTSITNPDPDDYERVILTGPIESGETQHRPPEIEIEGDYIRVEGIWFGGAWFAGSNDPVSGDSAKGRELNVYGGGRLDTVREIENCTFFGFNGVRVGALEYSFFRNNRFIRNGKVNLLGDPPPLYFSANHGPKWQATHAIVDKNIFIRGTGYPINGWHSWRNFVVTRNFVAATWGGFITDGPTSEAQGPYGPGKDHLVAHNMFWKVTERNSHNGATLISENLHFLNNILAGKYDNRDDEPDSTNYAGTGGISVDRNENSGMYYKNLSNFQILDNAYYNLTLGMVDTDDNADRNFTLDVEDDWSTRHNAKKAGTYNPAMKTNALSVTDSTIDTLVSDIDTFFATALTTARMTTILNDTSIEGKFNQLQSITVPAASVIYQKGDSWYQPGTKVNIGPDTSMPDTPQQIWQEFSERGFYHYNATGEAFKTP